ncbi:immunoglobulin-like domain-containing protein [Alkaliphilus peptidifermentans]|uniref:Bacterial Ig-like domain-containing protein n=1 Tax=Alkaliphilus peptidifermentans DSM 18978 TaxID=1120976 RepID=A0A1G5KYW5_9FIRM|nr:immunoglobulin-like domain-containing protein [Alkaliphilus peptidifermentans]SCZ05270.1 hypothetical protein SAMN03080606_03852 [Alkaliphilus peptidifermentans DSM 18978]
MKKVISLTLVFAIMIVLGIVIIKNIKEATVTDNINDSTNGLQPTRFLPEQMNTLEGVSFIHVEYYNDANTIKWTLQNNTRYTIYYGEGIILEKNHNDEWYEIPYSGKVGFTSILNYLSPSNSIEVSLPMSTWVAVSAGKYRIVLEVSPQEHSKNLYPISAYFTIDQ